MGIAIVGSGNVATHLASSLSFCKDVDIRGVFSRNIEHARKLADKLSQVPECVSDNFELLSQLQPEVLLISVADNGLENVVSALPLLPSTIVAHTSGTLAKEVLMPISGRVGVFYPLQTFSKDVDVDVAKVPFFVEGSSPEVERELVAIAGKISSKVAVADESHRKVLHIAGVLSCNFPNILWEQVGKLLNSAGYDLNVVEPLIRATIDKAFTVGPHEAQTGPARRGDVEVMKSHIEQLSGDMQDVYRLLSKLIMTSHNIVNKEI